VTAERKGLQSSSTTGRQSGRELWPKPGREGKLHVLDKRHFRSAEHEFGKTFWQPPGRGFAMFRNAIHTNNHESLRRRC